jgi:hypothetical protein
MGKLWEKSGKFGIAKYFFINGLPLGLDHENKKNMNFEK